jgi:purine nucleosidase
MGSSGRPRMRILIDTDTNNELDDQHAIAYALFNGGTFEVVGVTVNRTDSGGGIDDHVAEAQRVVRLTGHEGRIPVVKGADRSFEEIRPHLGLPDHDGSAAVDFIIEQAYRSQDFQGRDPSRGKLLLLPIGKLTNVALALVKDPAITDHVRVLWLGTNYPEPGEFNLVNDEGALTYLLESEVEFAIAVVRYGAPSGTDAVRTTVAEVAGRMAGRGPRGAPVEGRHGGTYETFGDYSVDLFAHASPWGDPPSRALYDMAALAIVKNPTWARSRRIPAPALHAGRWVERPQNPRQIVLWEHFDRNAILDDFFGTMERVTPGLRPSLGHPPPLS